LADLFNAVRKLVEAPILLTTRTINVAAKPNLVFRGLLAHLASANEDALSCPFDREAQDIFLNRIEVRQSSWNLFYWLYLGKQLVLMRNMYHMTWSPNVEVRPMFLLKLYPLAFLFLKESWFMGLPNVRKFFVEKDEAETDIPIPVLAHDPHPLWPATTSDRNTVISAGNTFGLIGSRR